MSLSTDQNSNAVQDQTVSEQIVTAVAEANDVPPTSLDPLYDAIDPDALEVLFQSDAVGHIEFSYEGHDVVVYAGGHVTVSGAE